MEQVKCANCGRVQVVQQMPQTQSRAMTPFERQRQRWFYLDKLDVVLCGGSLAVSGIDDGKDWCMHLHHENNQAAYYRVRDSQVVEIFMPGMLGCVPEGAKKHLEVANADDPSVPG